MVWCVPLDELQVNVPCIEQYLKGINFLDSDYLFSQVNGSVNCSAEIEKFKRESIDSTSKDRAISNSLATCIENGFKFYKVHEYSMKMFVYGKSGQYAKPQENPDFLAAMNDLDKIIKIVKFKMCSRGGTKSSKFAESFDTIYAGSGGANIEKKLHDDHNCLIKFVVENSLSDTDEVNLEDFAALDCNGTIAKLRESAHAELKDDFLFVLTQNDLHKQCVKDKIDDSEYFDNYAVAATLKDFDPSEGIRNQEKNIFVKVLILLYKNIMECAQI